MSALIEQPAGLQFPLRVPVVAAHVSGSFQAEVLGSSPHVVLLQALERVKLPPLGTPLRLQVGWDRQHLNGRLAAYGVKSRLLVTLGERAIRGTRRYPVDLPATVRSAQFKAVQMARIVDLSTSGARLEGAGARLPVGAELELHFIPPGHSEPMVFHGFVMRNIPDGTAPAVGIAFGLASPVLQLGEPGNA